MTHEYSPLPPLAPAPPEQRAAGRSASAVGCLAQPADALSGRLVHPVNAGGNRTPAAGEAGDLEGAPAGYLIELPWPRGPLWPNRRGHWSVVQRHRNQAKHDAWALCKAAGVRNVDAESVHVSLTFCAPDRRRYDLDNALAALKGSVDGIALALGVDDSRFSLSIAKGEPVKGGLVLVRIAA